MGGDAKGKEQGLRPATLVKLEDLLLVHDAE